MGNSKNLGGSYIRHNCPCGNPAAPKGIDKNGKTTYRSRCYKCKYAGQKQRKKVCDVCNIKAGDGIFLEIDHINNDPSDNRIENLQTLCRKCHIAKTKINKDWKNKHVK